MLPFRLPRRSIIPHVNSVLIVATLTRKYFAVKKEQYKHTVLTKQRSGDHIFFKTKYVNYSS